MIMSSQRIRSKRKQNEKEEMEKWQKTREGVRRREMKHINNMCENFEKNCGLMPQRRKTS